MKSRLFNPYGTTVVCSLTILRMSYVQSRYVSLLRVASSVQQTSAPIRMSQLRKKNKKIANLSRYEANQMLKGTRAQLTRLPRKNRKHEKIYQVYNTPG